MMDHYYDENVRIVCKPAAAPSCDLVVQRRKDSQSEWVEVARFNDMSDDHAHTNAHRAALRARDFPGG